MSKYTTEVRFICENSAGLTESVGYNSINEVLDKSRDKIFDFDFPIFDEAYRPVLENKILKHYYTREICCETVGLWKHFLDTRMNEIMPYYNKLYESALIEFNPLYDVDLTTDYQKVDNGNNDKTRGVGEKKTFSETDIIDENVRTTDTTTSTSETDGATGNTTTIANANKNDHWEYFSDTPEGGINGVANLNYLTNATHITDDGTGSMSTNTSSGTTHNENETVSNSTGSGERDNTTTKNGNNSKTLNENSKETIKNVEDYLQHVVGKKGSLSYSKLLEEYRDTFINIDLMIIKELKDLFMNIW